MLPTSIELFFLLCFASIAFSLVASSVCYGWIYRLAEKNTETARTKEGSVVRRMILLDEKIESYLSMFFISTMITLDILSGVFIKMIF